jgi:hypothetical protein
MPPESPLDFHGFRRSFDGIGAGCGASVLDGTEFLIDGHAWGVGGTLAAIKTRRSLTI